jgi:hypothetical protein
VSGWSSTARQAHHALSSGVSSATSLCRPSDASSNHPERPVAVPNWDQVRDLFRR